MPRARMTATMLVIAGLIASEATAQQGGFLRIIPRAEDGDQQPEARTWRFYEPPAEIRIHLFMANESSGAIELGRAATSAAITTTVRRDGRKELAIDRQDEVASAGVDRGSLEDTLRIDAGATLDYVLKLRPAPPALFHPGIYEVTVGLSQLAGTARDDTGRRWTGRHIPETSITVVVAPPRGARERSAAFLLEGRRATRAKRPLDALSAYVRATEADPTDLAARTALGTAYLQMARYPEAIVQLEEVAAHVRADGHSPVPEQLAYAYLAVGDERNAMRVLRNTGAAEASVKSTIERFRARISAALPCSC